MILVKLIKSYIREGKHARLSRRIEKAWHHRNETEAERRARFHREVDAFKAANPGVRQMLFSHTVKCANGCGAGLGVLPTRTQDAVPARCGECT